MMEFPPNLAPEGRSEIERLARQRIDEGNSPINQAREKMADPATAQNPAASQEATAQIRRGLALVESGVAAQRGRWRKIGVRRKPHSNGSEQK